MNRAGGLLLRPGGNGNLNVGTLFEAYLIAIPVSQGVFNTEISIPAVRPGHGYLCLSGWIVRRDAMILLTLPDRVALARPGTRSASRFNSAFRADFVIRGFAISFLMLARVALSDSFLFNMHSS